MEQANRMVGASAIGAALLIGLCTPSARAGYVVDLTQQGSNVVATGSGTINLGDLTFSISEPGFPEIFPSLPGISLGADGEIDVYGFATPPPTNFGSGGGVFADTGSGDLTIAAEDGEISVPAGYVSGSPSQAARSGTVRPSIASALRPAFTNGRGAVA